MNLLWLNVAVLSVAVVYCIYQTHVRITQRKHRHLRERVTYLLWVAAERTDECRPSLVKQ